MGDDVEPVAWLDEGQQRAWRAYLRAGRLLDVALDRDLGDGVQLSEYEILVQLSEAPQRRRRMSEIADLVVQSRSRLTHTASRLERQGWVAREQCSGDRRGVELLLTDEGMAELVRLAPVHVASVRRHLVDLITPEQLTELGTIMVAISEHLDPARTSVGEPREV